MDMNHLAELLSHSSFISGAKDKRIDHLDNSEIKSLILKYYSEEIPIKDLLFQYKINIHVSGLVSLFPPILVEGVACIHCGGKFCMSWGSRKMDRLKPKRCLECGHVDAQFCSCEACSYMRRKQVEMEEVEKRKVISRLLKIQEYGPYRKIEELTAKDAVYLLVFFRYCTSDKVHVGSLHNLSDVPLTPDRKLDIDIVRGLLDAGLIAVSPESDLRAFIYNEKGEPEKTYFDRATYQMLAGENQVLVYDYIRSLEKLAYDVNRWPKDWYAELLELSKMLLLYESMEYFQYVANKHGFDAPTGEKTKMMLENLLTDFSLSEIYNIIWSVGTRAAGYYLRERVPRKQAANSMVGSCQRTADKARVEGWKLKPFGRDHNCPRSALNYVLFDIFLRIGDKGFSTVLSDQLYDFSSSENNS